MHPNLRRAHDALWKRFFNPETNLLYDIPFTHRSQYATREEMLADLPTWKGGGSGLEDCTLAGGWVLDGMLSAYRVSGEAEWAEKARRLFEGLCACGTIGPRKGLLARGFAPGRTEVWRSTSADMYASFFYGLWRYTESPVCTDADRARVAEMFADAARLIESFDDDIPTTDLKPNLYGDLSALEPGRACRILQVYRAAHALTGDAHWAACYRDRLEAHNRIRLQSYYGPDPHPPTMGTHGVWQSQAAFRQLYQLEEDPKIREAYRIALDGQAAALMPRLREEETPKGGREGVIHPGGWRERVYVGERAKDKPDYVRDGVPYKPIPGRRIQCLATVLLSEDDALKREAADIMWPVLSTWDMTQPGPCHQVRLVDLAYWRGVEQGLFPRT